MSRIAIVNPDKCKPKKCKQECKRMCPVNRTGKICVEIEKNSTISESMCIGCGICVTKCPFDAIKIINLPKSLPETSHRYGPNQFKLHRLPQPRKGYILGIVGANGTGKSTILKILGGKLMPNLGIYSGSSESEIIRFFRGSELQNYFRTLYQDDLKTVIKPQYVDAIPRVIKGKISTLFTEKKVPEKIIKQLELENTLEKDISVLSGGELQRLAIAITISKNADVYIFDEPSSFLDVRQRINIGKIIREYCEKKYVIVVEHDLSLLDYLSDYLCFTYGSPGAYGIVSLPHNNSEGINYFLDGYTPSENMRFRDHKVDFRLNSDEQLKQNILNKYTNFSVKLGTFNLYVEPGEIYTSNITVLLGRNGCGKTTLVRALAGHVKTIGEIPVLNISYKPQKILPRFQGTVQQLFHTKIGKVYTRSIFHAEVIKPLQIERLYDRKVKTLSGGELQRVAIVLSLGKPADIYLLDEPSAYLDSEQRLTVSRVLKSFIKNNGKTAYIVEHDLMMVQYLADQLITFSGEPGKVSVAHKPTSVSEGMNIFLKEVGITLRKDCRNARPRVNKENSALDQEQKNYGKFYCMN